jgi:putative addiction module component (TIGR02574 family)
MGTTIEQIIGKILELPVQTRAFLAEKLLESLDYEEDFEISPEWMKEIKRRCKEIDNSAARLVPAEQVLADLHRLIK